MSRSLLICAVCLLITALPFRSYAVSDYQWTFMDSFSVDYTLSSVSSTDVYAGALPANDPPINLIVGKRYAVDIPMFMMHPLEIIAKAPSAGGDIILLSQGGVTGSFESDPAVAWVDGGTQVVEFTVTLDLANAMRQSGLTPGYRCVVHPLDMRGDFVLFGAGSPIADPLPTPIAKGDIVIELELVADGLAAPLGVADPDDGSDRLFLYDQDGRVHIVQSGSLLPAPLLDVNARLVPLGIGGPGSYDERGLLGLALHPDFASNGKLYTYTSEPVSASADFTLAIPVGRSFNHQSVVAEWVISTTDANAVDPASRREILRIDQPQFNHNGGAIRFGPDDLLYIALGDGGGADDEDDTLSGGLPLIGHGPEGNGQNIETIHGSVLRIDVDGNTSANGQYGVPAANPFVGVTGVDEIFAYGFRNPFAFSFDQSTGDLWLGDVGQNDIEEINVVTLGGNYGWRLKEGSFYFDPNGTGAGFVTTEPVRPLPPGLIDPVAEYDHDDGIAVIGGFVYRGAEISALAGRYVTGDFGSFATPVGRLFYLDGGDLLEFQIGDTDRPLGLWLKGLGEDAQGNLYVCGSTQLGPSGSTGQVLKIVPGPRAAVEAWASYR